MRASAHRGLGFGPDRLQRLCSFPYLETAFRVKFGGIFLRPDLITLSAQREKSALVDDYVSVLGAASATDAPDVAWIVDNELLGKTPEPTLYFDSAGLNALPVAQLTNRDHLEPGTAKLKSPKTFGDAAEKGFACGIFMLEPGPFLRGKMNTDAIAELPAVSELFRVGGRQLAAAAPRSLGDAIAFDALFAEMASHGMFDWTPDGVVLSKLVDPTGDPMASAQIDARSAQLFNVAVAGPAICSSWTGVSELACLPGDEVFVLIVADSAVVVDADNTQAEVAKRRTDTAAKITAVAGLAKTVKGGTALNAAQRSDLVPAAHMAGAAAGKTEASTAATIAAGRSKAEQDAADANHKNFVGFVEATATYVAERKKVATADSNPSFLIISARFIRVCTCV
jgi:hypothetical protein